MPRNPPPVAVRFWKYVEPEPMSGCWLWSGCYQKHRHGHGVIKSDGRNVLAHRLSYEMHVGPIPEGLLVCHKCNIAACVNPDHLYVGTYTDNNRDTIRAGRHNHKSKTHCKNGHEFTEANTFRSVVFNGTCHRRTCRTCQAVWIARFKQKRAQNAA